MILLFCKKQVLQDGTPKFQSPPDMSLITCLAMTNDCNVIAYGCYNGSVRLYYLHSGSVKTLGSHKEKVMDLSVSMEIMPEHSELKMNTRRLQRNIFCMSLLYLNPEQN